MVFRVLHLCLLPTRTLNGGLAMCQSDLSRSTAHSVGGVGLQHYSATSELWPNLLTYSLVAL